MFLRSVFWIFTISVSLFGILVLFEIQPFSEIQKVFYNFRSIDSNGNSFLLVDSISRDQRTFSFFTAANQYGAYAALSIVIGTILYKDKHIGFWHFAIYFICSALIIFSSQSRTSFFLFFLFLFLTMMSKINIKTIFLMALISATTLMFYDLLPERLISSADSSSFQSNLESQRLTYWYNFISKFTFDLEFVFHGFYNQSFLKNDPMFFESGILNFMSKHGLIATFIFFSLIVKSLVNIKTKKLSLKLLATIGNITKWGLIVLLSGEILQGWMLSYRLETILSIFISLAYLNQDVKQLNNPLKIHHD
jgi:hypothetical protein